MTPRDVEVARRAVAWKGWRWMSGMRWAGQAIDSVQRLDEGQLFEEDERWAFDPLPDLTDPATRGCLLTLVREAWSDPGLAAVGRWTSNTGLMWHVTGGKPHGGTFNRMAEVWHDSEAAALVAALEAAP